MTDNEKVEAALQLAFDYGASEGDHHRAWVIDQIVRALTGDNYESWIDEWCDGEDGPETYAWYEGVAP